MNGFVHMKLSKKTDQLINGSLWSAVKGHEKCPLQLLTAKNFQSRPGKIIIQSIII